MISSAMFSAARSQELNVKSAVHISTDATARETHVLLFLLFMVGPGKFFIFI
jgi:hypothetical protein